MTTTSERGHAHEDFTHHLYCTGERHWRILDLMERASFANAHPPVRFEPSAANPGAVYKVPAPMLLGFEASSRTLELMLHFDTTALAHLDVANGRETLFAAELATAHTRGFKSVPEAKRAIEAALAVAA